MKTQACYPEKVPPPPWAHRLRTLQGWQAESCQPWTREKNPRCWRARRGRSPGLLAFNAVTAGLTPSSSPHRHHLNQFFYRVILFPGETKRLEKETQSGWGKDRGSEYHRAIAIWVEGIRLLFFRLRAARLRLGAGPVAMEPGREAEPEE